MRSFVLTGVILGALAVGGCASQQTHYYPPVVYPEFIPLSVETADYIRLGEGPCRGSCPVYELTLYPNGQYVLMGQRFTEGENRSDNRPGDDSFAEAQAVLLSAGFEDLPEDITPENADACPAPATDMATSEITIGDQRGYYRQVRYYQGCFDAVADTMLRQLRGVMRVADLVQAAEAAPAD